MKKMYVWQQADWQNFPNDVITENDVCVLIGNGVLAKDQQHALPCPLFVVSDDSIPSSTATVIDHAQWLQFIIAYDKIVSL